MRRRDFLRAAGVAAAALVLDISPLEGGQGSRRAVRAELNPKGGWVHIKANAAGELTVKVRLNHGYAGRTYYVSVIVNGEPALSDTLTADERGKGTVSLSDDSYDVGQSIKVQVFVWLLPS